MVTNNMQLYYLLCAQKGFLQLLIVAAWFQTVKSADFIII